MKLLKKLGSSVVRKTILATALMGSFLAFLGAGIASARPRVYVREGIGGPVVVRGGYYAPAPYWRPVYAPRYGYRVYYPGVRYRYWDARFHCFRYR